MTLLIAFLVMDYVGVTNPFVYLGVVVLWVVHIIFHMGFRR